MMDDFERDMDDDQDAMDMETRETPTVVGARSSMRPPPPPAHVDRGTPSSSIAANQEIAHVFGSHEQQVDYGAGQDQTIFAQASSGSGYGAHGINAGVVQPSFVIPSGLANDIDATNEGLFGDATSTVGAPSDAGDNFAGFDEVMMRYPRLASPFLCAHSPSEPWVKITATEAENWVPKRAMCFNVLSDFFRRDAEWFSSFQLPKGSESRCKATAAVLSALFSGISQGLVSGKHEELVRGTAESSAQTDSSSNKTQKAKPLSHVERYMYVNNDNEQDSLPMFQIGCEELFNSDATDIVALRIWIFIYDEQHSTSELLRHTMDNNSQIKSSQRAGAETAKFRNKDSQAEGSRHDKAGLGFSALDSNFEANVGMQHKRICNVEDWQQMLEICGGKTSHAAGLPCVKDMVAHMSCPAARNEFRGDKLTGFGGRHPLSPEFVLNAKRPESLLFGLVNLDGSLVDIHPVQADVSTYWIGDGCFRTPVLPQSIFYLSTSLQKKSIFDLPLTRPLQGTVVPGTHLMMLFLEQERRAQIDKMSPEDKARTKFNYKDLTIDQNAYNRLRSMATNRDEYQRKQDLMLKKTLNAHDMMSAAGTSLNNGGDLLASDTDNFTVCTVSTTTRIARESDAIYSLIISPWRNEQELMLTEMARPLQEAGIDQSSRKWTRYWDKRAKFQRRFALVKEDLTRYHLRLLRTAFLSTKDASTLPAGFKAMFTALEEGVHALGGSASIAYNGGMHGNGRQLMCKDRQVWGNLQEWLRGVWVDTCRVDGRDRRIMDEIYCHCFEMYCDQTFVLIIASEKGQGKSVRAERMAEILPKGWTSVNGANSQRAGMNGNNSPSNGTQVICDEMIADLVKAECDERMEYYKTIVGKRQYEIERTRTVKTHDGTESMITCKIVTDHRECYLVCCNLGQCFTVRDEEPTAGKEAMIQRTVCLQARKETLSDSPKAEFEQNLKRAEVQCTVRDFRLFTALVGFVRLAMFKIEWLQPDFALAQLIFKAGDRMLVEEYNLPRPEPRRLVKRNENLKTFCVMEAVARVFFFKQSAWHYASGKPVNGKGKKFDISDLWDVLRTLRPTREMIISAWAQSLEYSVGTSCHGLNIMNGVCEKLGFTVDKLFRRIPPGTTSESMSNLTVTEKFMNEIHKTVAGNGSMVVGANIKTLRDEESVMRYNRITRNEFRVVCQSANAAVAVPAKAIDSVAPDEQTAMRFKSALFPNFAVAGLFYKTETLISWMNGRTVKPAEAKANANMPEGTDTLNFREFISESGAKTYDFGWMVLFHESGKYAQWNQVAQSIRDIASIKLFDCHLAGISDCLFMLASSENSRLCPEMPNLPSTYRQQLVMTGADNMPVDENTQMVQPAIVKNPDGTTYNSQAGPTIEARASDHPYHRDNLPLHKELDNLNGRCRLSALQPLMSTRVTRASPVRRAGGQTIEVNTVTVIEHVSMLVEAILRCSRVPGLAGLQERFVSGGSVPPGLSAVDSAAGCTDADVVSVLPFSYDLMPISFVLDLCSRFYSEGRDSVFDAANRTIVDLNLGSTLTEADKPEVSLRYPGFPTDPKQEKQQALRLLSVQFAGKQEAGAKTVDISKANSLQEIDPELLRHETEITLGRACNMNDIESHRKNLLGGGYTWGVTGDLFSSKTFDEHLRCSLVGRGSSSGAIDKDGRFTDLGFNHALDEENQVLHRILEKQCAAEDASADLKALEITPARASTYSNMESIHATTSNKKARVADAPRFRASDTPLSMSPAVIDQHLDMIYDGSDEGSEADDDADDMEFEITHGDSRSNGFRPVDSR